ncbi:MAG: malto-oligosyltrehalose trehalohydrolase [Acidimicrobiia bacterium]|nr:malto-oligosyltrehalose trehalohydrolase [Acidimicrobiia bacterium]
MRAEVWAPHAGTVDVVLVDGSHHRLERDATGWHRGGPELVDAEEYRFSLDGGDPLPDPRSHWQPDGIDGPSAAVDHGAFPWTDDEWQGFQLPGSVVYELHVGTFSAEGDFDAAILHLDHLVDLGVDAVEVMPIAEFSGERGWGYDGVLLWAPHHAYGGPGAFKRFVDACHRRGLGVILDVVYNHLGPVGNHLSRFGPYFHDRHQTPWGDAVNLDGPDAAEVRAFIIGNAAHWFVDHHVDGLRLDAVHALVDESPRHLLEELAEEVEHLAANVRRPLWLIAEDDRPDTKVVLGRDAGGHGLHARWADDLHHALHAAITGETSSYYAAFGPVGRIAEAIDRLLLRSDEGVPAAVSSHRFVTCAQNHDQVGNRATGDRLSHQAGLDAALAAAAIVLLAPGTPMLFQGEEWAASAPFPYFCDVDDPELAAAIRDGRRREFAEFGWDPASIPDPLDPATAAAAHLDWSEVGVDDHARAHEWYRALLRLRRERPDVTDGRRDRTSVHADEATRLVVVRRERTAVLANLGTEAAAVPPSLLGAGAASVLLASAGGLEPALDGSITLPAGVTAVLATG